MMIETTMTDIVLAVITGTPIDASDEDCGRTSAG